MKVVITAAPSTPADLLTRGELESLKNPATRIGRRIHFFTDLVVG